MEMGAGSRRARAREQGLLSIDEFEKMSQETRWPCTRGSSRDREHSEASIIATSRKDLCPGSGNPKFSRFDRNAISKQITIPTLPEQVRPQVRPQGRAGSENDKLLWTTSSSPGMMIMRPRYQAQLEIRAQVHSLCEGALQARAHEESEKILKTFYIRRERSGSTTRHTITLRQFEPSCVRRARPRCSSARGQKEDAQRAIKLMRFSLSSWLRPRRQIDVDRPKGRRAPASAEDPHSDDIITTSLL